MAKDTCKKMKWFFSYQQEGKWLEDMAGQGWFLEDITMGVIYSFRKGEPKRMLYEIDRFNLPKQPALEEIRHKEIFLEMAEALGWQQVTHDEEMTYYFCKEYAEGEINELYNDEESRIYRAKKFGNFIRSSAKRLAFWAFIVSLTDFIIKLTCWKLPELGSHLVWYDWFTVIFAAYTCGLAVWSWNYADRNERELLMTRQEWAESVNPEKHKTVRKIVLTVRGLNRLLQKEETEGWILQSVTPTGYFFIKSTGGQQIYTMDTDWLTNRRRKAAGAAKIGDGRDWHALNNDWQLQSVKEAEEKGWTFVCALENRTIIYRGDAGHTEPLNDERYDHSLRFTSLIGKYGVMLLLCGTVGAVIGFCVAWFGFL